MFTLYTSNIKNKTEFCLLLKYLDGSAVVNSIRYGQGKQVFMDVNKSYETVGMKRSSNLSSTSFTTRENKECKYMSVYLDNRLNRRRNSDEGGEQTGI